jgi:Conidiation protein 6
MHDSALHNPNVSDKAKKEAEVKLHGLEKLKDGEHGHA